MIGHNSQTRQFKSFAGLPGSLLVLLALLSLPSWLTVAGTNAAVPKSTIQIDFNRDIRPIFSENCYACHGPDKTKQKAGLRFDLKEEAFKKLESGNFALAPGDPAKSKLLQLVASEDDGERMPPKKTGKRLSAAQVDLLRRWVEQGAKWTAHWSYIPPVRPAVPEVKNKKWRRNDIDNFILARLEKEKFQPSPEADKATLIRRVSLDLTGLPPTLAEADDFLADKSPAAYEKLVDRLLASPHYGERMALTWLDAARFADTSGYHNDSIRYMWPWRDWVINAFNQNKSFDQFTIDQLAGDLLPSPTLDQKIASGFHRNVMTTDEGGADPAEYLAKYIVDRVNTTAVVWLGTTMGCAECHDHKYDPIAQKEFYQLYAFFHNVPEKGLDGIRDGNPAPIIRIPSAEQGSRHFEFLKFIPEAESVVKTRESELPAAQARWEQEVLAKLTKPVEPDGLLAHFPLDESPAGTDALGARKEATYQSTNAPAWVTGKLGKALELDGKGGFIDAGNIAGFERTNSFSFGCWTKIKGKDGVLIAKMDDSASLRGYDLEIKDGKALVHLIHSWPTNALEVATKEALPKEGWLHLMVTIDGTNQAEGIKIFLNGKAQAVEVKENKLTGTITNQVPLQIGQRLKTLPFEGVIDDVRIYNRALNPQEVDHLARSANLAIVPIPGEKRTDEQKADLKKFFRENHAVEFKKAEADLAKLRKGQEDLLKQIPTTMVMQELETPRDTFVLVRGNFQNRGEKVSPGVPKFLPPLPEGASANRLSLAKWLVATNHPLTSRVTVNRYWQMLFGTGLVKTVNDFGSQGEWPSHPELLDWLACEFVSPVEPSKHSSGKRFNGSTVQPFNDSTVHAWDIKRMLKLMVMSATYRLSAVATPQALQRDPYNRLLARGPHSRLDAELIRDNALAVSGLLNPKIGGESVSPYQPVGIWEVSDRSYTQSKGDDLYRRGVYVYWRRSTPYPSFITFDAPNRETCAVQRPRTSTPLQSLTLMNDPVYVEAARGLAQRILKEGGPDLNKQLTYAIRLTLARAPRKQELEILAQTYREQLKNYQENEEAATALVSIGEAAQPKNVDTAELAAWTAIGNVLLNLNETITK